MEKLIFRSLNIKFGEKGEGYFVEDECARAKSGRKHESKECRRVVHINENGAKMKYVAEPLVIEAIQ